MKSPQTRPVHWADAHRLIPSHFSDGGTVLAPLAGSDRELEDLILLDAATNDRIRGEQFGSLGISQHELVYGIPHAHIVNAAFLYPGPFGSRFNDHTRGAWYAADLQEASIAEVAYHKSRNLSDVMDPEGPKERPAQDISTYDDWLATFQAEFYALDPPADFADYLQPEPVPACYAVSQALARRLLSQNANGVLYPSIRYPGASCIACFRPALVYNPRRSERLELTLTASATGYDYHTRRLESFNP